MLAAFTCWSWYSTAAQRWLECWSQLKISCVTMTIGGVALTIVYFCLAALGGVPFPPPAPPSGQDLLVLLWLILALVSFGVVLWNFGVKRSGVVTASLYLNLTPIVAILILSMGGHHAEPAAGDRRRHGDPGDSLGRARDRETNAAAGRHRRSARIVKWGRRWRRPFTTSAAI